MQEKVDAILEEIKRSTASSSQELEEYRLKFISKKSIIGELFNEMKSIPNDQKKAFGMKLNELKQSAQARFKELIDSVNNHQADTPADHVDLTLPPAGNEPGSIHPLSYMRYKIIEIFERIGFNVADGPEIEDSEPSWSGGRQPAGRLKPVTLPAGFAGLDKR